MALEYIEIVNGIFSLIFVGISVLIGATIASRYLRHKQRIFILVGFTWILLVSIWWASSISFLAIIFTSSQIPDEVFMFVGNFFLPITMCLWLAAFTEMKYQDKQKLILLIAIFSGLIFEIYYLYFLFTDSSVLGEVYSPVDVNYTIIPTLYQIMLLFVFLITGIIFANESLKSEKPEINLKGKLLITALLLFVAGSILEILSGLSIIILIIGRITLIFSAIFFYGGFILPEFMRKLFLKS